MPGPTLGSTSSSCSPLTPKISSKTQKGRPLPVEDREPRALTLGGMSLSDCRAVTGPTSDRLPAKSIRRVGWIAPAGIGASDVDRGALRFFGGDHKRNGRPTVPSSDTVVKQWRLTNQMRIGRSLDAVLFGTAKQTAADCSTRREWNCPVCTCEG